MNYDMILQEAHLAGQKALENCKVTMYKWSTGGSQSYEVHGNCGCAWVMTRERGNGQFVKYLKARYGQNRIYKDGYRKAWKVPTDDMDMSGYNGQEVDPKYAYCEAYADVLNDHGIKACAYEYLT